MRLTPYLERGAGGQTANNTAGERVLILYSQAH
jgi:hypothetical protein